jgi:hypothetical protein
MNETEDFIPVIPENLVGAMDIAKRLGYAFPNIVHQWRKRYKGFPKPLATLSMGSIWDWKEVEDWAVRTKRLTERERRA